MPHARKNGKDIPMKVKIAAVQMPVVADKDENLQTMRESVHRAAEEGASIVTLPEMFCCPYANDSFVANKEPAGGKTWTALSETAAREKIWLVGGSLPECTEAGNIYNTCFIFDRTGREIGRHRKVHLFDIDVKGGQRFKESDVFTAGDDFTVVETDFGKIGVIICFDIRFPELSRILALQGAQIIFVPGAFNMTTGPAHWDIHFRSRALDNQVFMVGCAPARADSGYRSFGHSIAVDPWGRILKELEFEPGILVEEFELDDVPAVREQLPLLKARRTDRYALEWK